MYGLLDSVGEGEGGMFQENSIETCILTRVRQITSPGWMQEQVLRAGALGRPRGIGWRGRWEGGSGWGIHVYPRLINVNVWQKPLQYCKVISLRLIIKKRKKKIKIQWLASWAHFLNHYAKISQCRYLKYLLIDEWMNERKGWIGKCHM